jgi:HTH-type transcriptional regulator/antitoxin HigA
MGSALKAIEEIKEEVERSSEVIPKDSLYRKLLETFPLRPLGTEEEYKIGRHIVSRLLVLLESEDAEVQASQAGIEKYLKNLAGIVEAYEKNTYPDVGKNVSGKDMLKFFMESNGLQQGDLKKELGGQPVVSAILRGERKLNLRQISALAVRFNISPEVFIDLNEIKKRQATRRLGTKTHALKRIK